MLNCLEELDLLEHRDVGLEQAGVRTLWQEAEQDGEVLVLDEG
jgi:hypothetical protein